jgi:hypothetical protein
MAEVIILIILVISIKDQLDFFIGDNAGTNNTIIRCILTNLRPDIKDPDSRRMRCLGYIINLAAKAFLFGKDADTFEEESCTKKQLSKLEAVRKLWRKKGPLRKFCNTVCFIRKAPQRRKSFLSIYRNEIGKEIEGKLSKIFRLLILRINMKS